LFQPQREKMKKNLVILFYPKTEPDNIYRNLPVAMLKLASGVTAHGFRVKVIDSRIEKNYVSALNELLPQAVCFGVSVITGYQIFHGLRASEIVKQRFPDLPVIWGGWHPSLLSEETIQNNCIDIVARGQGERTLIELINSLQNNLPLEEVKGIIYKNKNGEIVSNPQRPFEDINNFAAINFNSLDLNKYIHQTPLGKRTIFWNTSQGCFYSCGFCCSPAMYGKHWSGLKVERILAEIETLIKDFGIDSIVFCEDNFFTDNLRVSKLCQGLLNRNMRLKWSTDGRIDRVVGFSDDYLSLLKESGCEKIFLGAESGDQDVLNLIDKKIRVKDTFAAAVLLNHHNIIAEFFVMAGFFLNPEKDLRDTIRMVGEIKRRFPNHQATPTLYTPYPGTALFDLAKKKGFSAPAKLKDWVNWNIQTPTVPWVDKKYHNKFNMLVKFYLPLAYPSGILRTNIKTSRLGFLYKIMHKIAKFRVEKDIWLFPVEWYLVKNLYYRIILRKEIFKNIFALR